MTNTGETLRTNEEAHTIGEAKKLLIRKYRLTEPEAFNFIRRQSMNTQTKMSVVAKQLIKELNETT